jgi:signal transduction histidine kinase
MVTVDTAGGAGQLSRPVWAAPALGVLAIAGATVGVAVAGGGGQDMSTSLMVGLLIDVLAVAGVVTVLAEPSNAVGWLLVAAGAAMGVGTALVEVGVRELATGTGLGPGLLAATGASLQAAGWAATFVAVPVFFPDGRVPGPRWRWTKWTAAATLTALFFGNLLAPHANNARLLGWTNPLALPGDWAHLPDALSALAAILGAVTVGAAVVGLVVRWRRGGPYVRQQLALVAVAACPAALVLVVIPIVDGVDGWVIAAAALPLPVAVLVAILVHDLYDLRRATHRALLWGTLSAAVAAVYAMVVLAVAWVAPNRGAWWPSALAAMAAALVLLPLHNWLQRLVNRVVYGRWREPYDVLADLGRQLEAADVDRLLEAAVDELTSGLDLDDVSIRDARDGTIAGAAAAGETSLVLQAYGRTVGRLTFSTERSLTRSENRLVHDFARHLAGALQARTLLSDLQLARERLVHAREEERRRLRRDLHDGVGPALAGLTLKVAAARAQLPPSSPQTSSQLVELEEEIRQTASDVRRIVEGLRPPALDELGLAVASRQAISRLTAHTGMDVTVIIEPIPSLPAAVEVAAYRILVEAVTNVVRHAQAQHCTVTVTVTDGDLDLRVTDDGRGIGEHSPDGNGLSIIRERAEELGGTVMVTASAGRGVSIHATIPIPIRIHSGPPAQPLQHPPEAATPRPPVGVIRT